MMVSIEPYKGLIAALQGNLPVLNQLLEKQLVHINVQDNDGNTALILATANSQLPVVKELLKRGADVALMRKSGATALFFACQAGFLTVARELLAVAPRPVDHPGTSALLAAALNGHVACARLLLSAGWDVNCVLRDSATPLFLAAQSGHVAMVELLLQFGASVDLARKERETPLFIAAQMGHETVCKRLLQAGAVLDGVREDGSTALFKASQRGWTKVVQVLLESRASVGLLANGETALHAASLFGHDEIAQLLLDRGADPNLRNRDNLSSKDIAREAKFDSLLRLFESIEAKSVKQRALLPTPTEMLSPSAQAYQSGDTEQSANGDCDMRTMHQSVAFPFPFPGGQSYTQSAHNTSYTQPPTTPYAQPPPATAYGQPPPATAYAQPSTTHAQMPYQNWTPTTNQQPSGMPPQPMGMPLPFFPPPPQFMGQTPPFPMPPFTPHS